MLHDAILAHFSHAGLMFAALFGWPCILWGSRDAFGLLRQRFVLECT